MPQLQISELWKVARTLRLQLVDLHVASHDAAAGLADRLPDDHLGLDVPATRVGQRQVRLRAQVAGPPAGKMGEQQKARKCFHNACSG